MLQKLLRCIFTFLIIINTTTLNSMIPAEAASSGEAAFPEGIELTEVPHVQSSNALASQVSSNAIEVARQNRSRKRVTCAVFSIILINLCGYLIIRPIVEYVNHKNSHNNNDSNDDNLVKICNPSNGYPSQNFSSSSPYKLNINKCGLCLYDVPSAIRCGPITSAGLNQKKREFEQICGTPINMCINSEYSQYESCLEDDFFRFKQSLAPCYKAPTIIANSTQTNSTNSTQWLSSTGMINGTMLTNNTQVTNNTETIGNNTQNKLHQPRLMQRMQSAHALQRVNNTHHVFNKNNKKFKKDYR